MRLGANSKPSNKLDVIVTMVTYSIPQYPWHYYRPKPKQGGGEVCILV